MLTSAISARGPIGLLGQREHCRPALHDTRRPRSFHYLLLNTYPSFSVTEVAVPYARVNLWSFRVRLSPIDTQWTPLSGIYVVRKHRHCATKGVNRGCSLTGVDQCSHVVAVSLPCASVGVRRPKSALHNKSTANTNKVQRV